MEDNNIDLILKDNISVPELPSTLMDEMWSNVLTSLSGKPMSESRSPLRHLRIYKTLFPLAAGCLFACVLVGSILTYHGNIGSKPAVTPAQEKLSHRLSETTGAGVPLSIPGASQVNRLAPFTVVYPAANLPEYKASRAYIKFDTSPGDNKVHADVTIEFSKDHNSLYTIQETDAPSIKTAFLSPTGTNLIINGVSCFAWSGPTMPGVYFNYNNVRFLISGHGMTMMQLADVAKSIIA